MPDPTPISFSLGFFIFLILLSLMFFYQAWENLINKRVSKFSLDTLIIFMSNAFANPTIQNRTLKQSKDPKRLFLMGLFALLVFIRGSIEIYSWTKNFLINR